MEIKLSSNQTGIICVINNILWPKTSLLPVQHGNEASGGMTWDDVIGRYAITHPQVITW